MSPPQRPIPVEVCEAVSPLNPPSPDSTTAIFTVVSSLSTVLEVGRVVQLQIASEVPSNADDDFGTRLPPRTRRRRRTLLDLAFRGPIIGVRRCDQDNVEFIVRNAFREDESALRFAHLLVPRNGGVTTVPVRLDFADELARRLEAMLENELTAPRESGGCCEMQTKNEKAPL